MNKLYILIAIIQVTFLLGADSANAQWITQYPYTPGVGLLDIKFINKTTGWICGDGIILKTTNMGVNWIQQSHPAPDKYLYCIHPVDSNIVYCVGWFQTILKTTNGGENWFAIRNGPVGQGRSYYSVFFINSMTGWVGGGGLGSGGIYIFKTTDGCKTFDSVFTNNDIFDIHFKDSNTGLFVGGGGGISKTTNQGMNWNRINLPPNNYGDFRKISVISNKYCFVVEDGKRVYKSTNYGDSWDSVGYVYGADQPYTCRFSSVQTGWVGGTYGEIFKSTNGGATWNFQYVNTTNIGYIWSLGFLNDSIGWAIGGNTKLLFTSTSGATFISHYENGTPAEYILEQNYPNPFNSQTVISYSVPKRSFIQLTIFDALGRKIKEIENNFKDAGNYKLTFDASGLSSGIYFIRMTSGNNFYSAKKIILIK
jgi:photosystem II stability/assembly factor-like uncharacterized protein